MRQTKRKSDRHRDIKKKRKRLRERKKDREEREEVWGKEMERNRYGKSARVRFCPH